jgi:predicted MFS family arabinose efflux permease
VIGSFSAHWGRSAPGLVAAVLCLINVAFAWKWLPESRQLQSGHEKPVNPSLWGEAWMVVRHPWRPAARLIWIYAVGMLAFSSLTSVVALYLGMEFGITEKTIGYVFLYVGGLSLVMRSLCLGPIVERIGETWAMRLGASALVAGLLAYPLPANFWLLTAIMPLVPIGTALLFPSTTALLSRSSNKSELGATMGIAQTFGGISRMVAPVVATTLFQRFGHGTPFFVAGGVVALVSLLAFQVEPVPRAADSAC